MAEKMELLSLFSIFISWIPMMQLPNIPDIMNFFKYGRNFLTQLSISASSSRKIKKSRSTDISAKI